MNRESYLKKFHELKFDNIQNGLGIGTRIPIDIDKNYLKIGNTKYNSNKYLVEEDHLSYLDSSLQHSFRRMIEDPVLENKIDYMHAALRRIKILVIEESGEYLISRELSGNNYLHILVHVKDSVNATLFINTKTDSDDENSPEESVHIITEFLDVRIGDNSRIHIVDLRNFGQKYFVYSRKRVSLGSDSEVFWTNIEGPAKLNITELRSIISGKGSGSVMNTIVLSKDSEYNMFTRTDHNAGDTKSLMQVRNILNDSKSILRGLVYVDENARKSNGYQKTEMLLLDNSSRAISIPDLEIHNDEVKCTHGSSITRPDSEKIFYLQSRGLDEDAAEQLIIKGFYEMLLSEVPNGLKENVSGEIEKILYGEDSSRK